MEPNDSGLMLQHQQVGERSFIIEKSSEKCSHSEADEFKLTEGEIHHRPSMQMASTSLILVPLQSSKSIKLTSLHGQGTAPSNISPKYCRFCGKYFSNVAKYKAHEIYHSKAGRFPCKFCDKAFHNKANLVRHERVHTGEKPFPCKYCDKTFAQISHCRNHELIHTKVE